MRQNSSARGAEHEASGSREPRGAEQRERMAALLPGGEPVESLLRKAQFFTPGTPSEDYRELRRRGGRGAEEFYRERWLHATAAWLIWSLWPFSRLVHAFSYPLWYLWRQYIVFCSRVAAHPHEPGTGGRKWRKIGVPY